MSHLRLDPTRTTRLRAQFNSALMTRFDIFKRELKGLIIAGDALGLWNRPSILFNAGEWRFLQGDRKQEALKKWLKFRVGQLFLKQENDDSAQTWLGAYVKQAYQKGLKRAFDDWKRPTGLLMMAPASGKAYQEGRLAEFMRQSFGGPTPIERVQALATRTFNDIEGVTDSMSISISRLLLDAMATGINPREVGLRLDHIVGSHKNRGTAIARTELIRAFNEGALDGLENLGATKIGVMVEWSTSGLGVTKLGNPSPCPKCAPLAGLVFTVEEARGLLPRHQNCLCSYLPANVGEKSAKQIRDGKRIREAVLRAAGNDKQWIGASKKFRSK